MGKVLIDIQKRFIAKVPLKLNENSAIYERVYKRKDPLRWNRMYAHLWQQGIVEVGYDPETVEVWVLRALQTLDDNNKRIHPNLIGWSQDVVPILKNKNVMLKTAIDYDENLKDTTEGHTNEWFENFWKYGDRYFVGAVDYKWWWKENKDSSIINEIKYESLGISGKYATYKSYSGNKIEFYNNASADKNGTTGAFRDIYNAISEAKEFIFIADWSFHPYMRILHSEGGNDKSIGHILLEWARNNKVNGGQIAIHTWDHTDVAAKDEQNDNGKKHLEYINKKDFKDDKNPEFPTNLLWRASSRTDLGWSHHQKFVVLDYNAGNSKRGVKVFIGGLDLTKGRFDWYKHPIDINDNESSEFLRITNTRVLEPVDEDAEDYNDQTQPVELEPEIDDWYNAELGNESNPREYPRQPWRDIYCCVDGPTAYDVIREFVGRWNFDPAYSDAIGDDSSANIKAVQEVFKKIINSSKFVKQWGKDYHNGTFKAQIIRSITKNHWGSDQDVMTIDKKGNEYKEFQWTITNIDREHSIQDAYVEMINKAESFIYIESQYFIGSNSKWKYSPDGAGAGTNSGAKNIIPETIVNKILQKARLKQDFHVYLVLPMFPEGDPASSALQGIRDLQWTTLSYLIRAIVKAGCDVNKYLTLGFFANWGNIETINTDNDRNTSVKFNKRYMIYVHSKAMIVDDNYCIIGSANLNQRSLEGNRDSEIGVAIWSTDKDEVHPQIRDFRKDIWKNYFGLTSNDPIADFNTIQKNGRNNYNLFKDGKTKDGETIRKKGFFCSWPIDITNDNLGIRENKAQLIIDGKTSWIIGDDQCLWPTDYSDILSMDFLE